jgi:hypothetical protein
MCCHCGSNKKEARKSVLLFYMMFCCAEMMQLHNDVCAARKMMCAGAHSKYGQLCGFCLAVLQDAISSTRSSAHWASNLRYCCSEMYFVRTNSSSQYPVSFASFSAISSFEIKSSRLYA